MTMKTSVKFINHASVVVSDENISVLSDPWFSGDAFHKGWNLLHETGDNDIKKLLQKITHIWISHEHPDHFSISFFQNYSEILKNNSIKILFQKTSDKRVFKFLTAKGLNVKELEFNKSLKLSDDFTVKCIKDGFYDSGLLIDSHGDKILNLNDCEVTTPSRAKEVFSLTGKVDVLLTQFSYAAWKGGTKNKRWRVNAAQEKINTIKLQTETFRPKYLIPFASFFYFSNKENFLKIGEGSEWLEVLGCGMVNPIVLENCGLDSKRYSGFAFGLGIERFAMLKYQIADLRMFYDNDIKWLDHNSFFPKGFPSTIRGF